MVSSLHIREDKDKSGRWFIKYHSQQSRLKHPRTEGKKEIVTLKLFVQEAVFQKKAK